MAVVPRSRSARASHFSFVRLAMQTSVNTSLFWQHLWMATWATPPQPMINTLLILYLLSRSAPQRRRTHLPNSFFLQRSNSSRAGR